MSESIWVYTEVEGKRWAVGFYDPTAQWYQDSDHPTQEGAVARVRFLNGGPQVRIGCAARHHCRDHTATCEGVAGHTTQDGWHRCSLCGLNWNPIQARREDSAGSIIDATIHDTFTT